MLRGGKSELIPSGQMYNQVNGEKSEMGIVNGVGAKSYLVCVEPKVEQMGQNAQLCNQARGEMSGKAPSVQLGIGNVVGTKSDMVCVDPKVEQTGQNAQVCNQAEGETSEMITGVQLGMVNVVGAKSDLVCVKPKVEMHRCSTRSGGR